MQLKIGIVRDVEVQHAHSGEPRKVFLPGEHVRLELDAAEFASLTERERIRLTKRWPRAYEKVMDRIAFYVPPTPRFKFLAAYRELTLEQFRLLIGCTSDVKFSAAGQQALELIELFFFEAVKEVRKRSGWGKKAESCHVSLRTLNRGVEVAICLPDSLLARLEEYGSLYDKGLTRLRQLDPNVRIEGT